MMSQWQQLQDLWISSSSSTLSSSLTETSHLTQTASSKRPSALLTIKNCYTSTLQYNDDNMIILLLIVSFIPPNNGKGGGLGILGYWVQMLLVCWINTRWGWLCLSSFWGQQNECQLAGTLCRSGDLSRVVPNSQGDCLGSTNTLYRVWSQSPPPLLHTQPAQHVSSE